MMVDLLAGRIGFCFTGSALAVQLVKEGKVRALAVTSKERNPALPEIPTAIEAGLKGFEVVGFYGFLAPAGTPQLVVDRLSQAFQKVIENPELRERMVSQGANPDFMGAAQFKTFLEGEMPRWADAVKRSGTTMD